MTSSRRSATKTKTKPQPKAEVAWMEIPVLIHGITPELDPHGNTQEYDLLIRKINAALVRHGKRPFSSRRIYVEWGWQSGQSTQKDRYLAELEQKVLSGVQRELSGVNDFTLNPIRLAYKPLRELFILGVPDLFYYLSADGEKALRRHVFDFVAKKIRELTRNPKTRLSLTFFGHSAGSVVAHDLLFHLFGQKDPEKKEEPAIVQDLNPVRGLIKDGRLRIRRLYTFGSPLTILSLRSDTLVDKMRNDVLLQPRDLGLRAADDLSNPRWVNFWDQDDVISGPLAFLYANEDQVVEDRYVNVGSLFPTAHTSYWGSDDMADHIARTF
jgi:hypothetical protein